MDPTDITHTQFFELRVCLVGIMKNGENENHHISNKEKKKEKKKSNTSVIKEEKIKSQYGDLKVNFKGIFKSSFNKFFHLIFFLFWKEYFLVH